LRKVVILQPLKAALNKLLTLLQSPSFLVVIVRTWEEGVY
jgi:hypothetical protein